MKILLLSHRFSPDVGGIESISEMLATEFCKAGHEVRILTWSINKSHDSFPFTVVRQPRLSAIVKELWWSDVVLENNPCLRLAWPRIFIKRPAVIALHTWISRSDGKISWQDKFKVAWLKQASKVTACSHALKNKTWLKAIVIENAYDTNLFKVLPDNTERTGFVFLGRLVSDKGAELAIQAIHNLNTATKKTWSNRKLTIIGDGPEAEQLRNLVITLHMTDFVHFTGVCKGNELVSILNKSEVLLVPSVWEEPFGIVVLEGMACGCIPIASDSGGLPEAVGDAGLLFKKGSVTSLQACMEMITNDIILVHQLRSKAPAHLQNYHPSLVAKKYLDVIKSAVSN